MMIQMGGAAAGTESWLDKLGASVMNFGPAAVIAVTALTLLAIVLIVLRTTSKGYDLDIRCRPPFNIQLSLRNKRDG